MKYNIASFDVFDTCLCRSCGNPTALYYLLAVEILGKDACESNFADFRKERIESEKEARKNAVSEEITIDQIYEYFSFSQFDDNSYIKAKEIELEKKVLTPIASTLQIVNKFRDEGCQIVFISDMYLPSVFIKSVLSECGFLKDGDKLYVSADLGVTKRTGKLFEYIRDDNNFDYKKWIHFGDNQYSDIKVPKIYGISARKVNHHYSFYQSKIMKQPSSPSNDFNSRIASISKAICAESAFDSNNKMLIFSADIIAPLYVAFVCHILKDARRRNIKKIYFLARDGYILYLIAKEFQIYYPEMEIHYLCVSRKSIYLPALDNINHETLKEITGNKIEGIDNLQVLINIDKIREGDFVANILNDTITKNHLIERWEQQKKLIIQYFKREGLAMRDGEAAIVDIRGTRKCQAGINHILQREGYKPSFAYYLEANKDRIKPETHIPYDAVFFGDYLDGFCFRNLKLTGILFEKCFCLNSQKRTSGYQLQKDGEIAPEFDKTEYLPDYYEGIQLTIENVCKKYVSHFLINNLDTDCDLVLTNMLAIISDFINKPNPFYLGALEGIYFSSNQNNSRKIISKYHFFQKNDKPIWKVGSMTLSFPLLARLYFLIRNIKNYFVD